MSTTRRPGSRRHPTLWADRGWPVLAGSLAAVGLLVDATNWGWLVLIAVAGGCFAFGSIMIFGSLTDFGVTFSRSARAAVVGTVVLLVAVGLIAASPLAGAVAVGIAGATSPILTVPIARTLRSRATQRRVDKAFARIVAHLETDRSPRRSP